MSRARPSRPAMPLHPRCPGGPSRSLQNARWRPPGFQPWDPRWMGQRSIQWSPGEFTVLGWFLHPTIYSKDGLKMLKYHPKIGGARFLNHPQYLIIIHRFRNGSTKQQYWNHHICQRVYVNKTTTTLRFWFSQQDQTHEQKDWSRWAVDLSVFNLLSVHPSPDSQKQTPQL